jgi:hypothetical protein
MSKTEFAVMDARARNDIDSATVFEVCETLAEAKAVAPDYGDGCCVVELRGRTQTLVWQHDAKTTRPVRDGGYRATRNVNPATIKPPASPSGVSQARAQDHRAGSAMSEHIITPAQHLANIANLPERDAAQREAFIQDSRRQLLAEIAMTIAKARAAQVKIQIAGNRYPEAVEMVLAEYRAAGWRVVGPTMVRETRKRGRILVHNPPLREYIFSPATDGAR